MSSCCTSTENSKNKPRQYKCPSNGKLYKEVSPATILHHMNEPWNWNNKDQGYYFCDDPDCDVVYFGEDDSLIKKSSLRTEVGIKEERDDALVCYCFGVSKKESKSQKIKEFVIENTKNNNCACVTRNPSGRCCLKDFA